MIVKRLGLVEYAPALEAMRVFTAGRDADTPDEIWLLQHPQVRQAFDLPGAQTAPQNGGSMAADALGAWHSVAASAPTGSGHGC